MMVLPTGIGYPCAVLRVSELISCPASRRTGDHRSTDQHLKTHRPPQRSAAAVLSKCFECISCPYLPCGTAAVFHDGAAVGFNAVPLLCFRGHRVKVRPDCLHLQQALNSRMYRVGAATASMGLFALALDTAGTLWLVCTWCFLQVSFHFYPANPEARFKRPPFE